MADSAVGTKQVRVASKSPAGTPRPVPAAPAAVETKTEGWVQPLRWAALAVWIAIPILALAAQSIAGRVVWTVAVAALPIFIVLVGYHRWRRICPLAFMNQIPVRLRRPGNRRAPAWLEDRYYFIPLGMFFIGLWMRLVWTNGDGVALAAFFVGISLLALLFGVLFTGKTWCNYICPVSFIEKIYTEPHGLRETRNSQCTKCTACKKACPDINEENGYWKEIESPSKRFAYFAYPGLVFGFYFYYWLQSGGWDYYFSGTWTNQPGVVSFAFLPGTDSTTAGFFFLQVVPRALAAALTLAVCALTSAGIFSLLEPRVRAVLRRRDASVDKIRVRHVMFGLAAFTAFVTFYSFAGQPTLRKIEWLPAYTSVLVVLTASLFLVRRLTRTPQAFAEQTLARNIIKRWEWADIRPPTDLHDAYVMHTARTSERERAYGQVVQAYEDAVRETIANGFISRAEVQRLESLRNQLQIKKTDHERVMATLAEEDRAVLADPTMQASAEKRLQLETYSRALARHLEGLLSTDRADDNFILQLRQEFGVTNEEHLAVLDRLLGDNLGTIAQVTDALRVAERAGQSVAVLRAQSSASLDLLADLLRRARRRSVERLLRTLNMLSGDAPVQELADWLTSDDEAQHVAAIEALRARVPRQIGDQLVAAHAEASASAGMVSAVPDLLLAYTTDTDPYVRALSLYALSERNPLDESVLGPESVDEHALVRATAEGLRKRLDARDDPGRDDPMLTVEKMVTLRGVPLFASLEPVALEDLAESSTDTRYAPGEALCIEGEAGDEVFVLMDGDAAVVAGTSREGEVLRVEHAGSVIGEMAVLESTLRSASVFAGAEGARVLRLNGAAFHAILDADPAVADGVIRTLARRIRTREVADAPIG
jgi:hypothetical protein